MIRFECPNCGQVIEADDAAHGLEAECPTCQNKFLPDKFIRSRDLFSPQVAPEPDNTVNKIHSSLTSLELELQGRRAKIRRHANSFCNVAVVLFIVGLLAALAAIIDNVPDSTLICGSSFALSLWLYLVGQIIHIRANTEK